MKTVRLAGSEGTTPSPNGDDSLTVQRADVGRDRLIERVLRNPQTALLIVIILFSAFVELSNRNFLTFDNVVNILRDGSFIFIIAVAGTFVLVGGGLDLSVGSVFALSSVASAMLIANYGIPYPAAFVLGIVVGALCGLVNAIIVIYGRIPALITTLGMLYVARGMTWIITGGSGTQYLPQGFGDIASLRQWGVPLMVYYAFLIGIMAHVILEHTRFGYGVRAVGGNREAARACGINVTRTTLILFVASGAAAGLSGVLMASRLQSGQPSIGQGLELQVITAAIIGGTSLFGGLGTIPGTFLGTLLIAVLQNGLVQIQIDPLWQNVVVGIVLVTSVGLDQVRRARMWRGPARARA
ncbi:MAG: ABC transporter permease [Candidatus Limnocylindrales bacterium]|jgi:ribose/xylose/arabinose/galactoside ABC-type transport system permease subunit